MLGQLPPLLDKNVLVGAANADDAGVYKITEDLAVVLTTDFFTPIVDDPYDFGAIAAANALSDIWAMGARPLVALNIAMFPNQPAFFPSLQKIVQGGIDKMTEAGVSIIGGHTIRDKEPKFGYSVMGTIHPDRILDNAKARKGDSLILTKKIGTGIVSTGIRAGICSADVIRELTLSMTALNKRAGEIMIEVGVSTATDITGFGLVGHLFEVLSASRCRASLRTSAIPFFDEAVRLARKDIAPGGTLANLKTYSPSIRWAHDLPDFERVLVSDAQTSGGLLIFVPAEKRDLLASKLAEEGITAAHIGEVIEDDVDDNPRIVVEK